MLHLAFDTTVDVSMVQPDRMTDIFRHPRGVIGIGQILPNHQLTSWPGDSNRGINAQPRILHVVQHVNQDHQVEKRISEWALFYPMIIEENLTATESLLQPASREANVMPRQRVTADNVLGRTAFEDQPHVGVGTAAELDHISQGPRDELVLFELLRPPEVPVVVRVSANAKSLGPTGQRPPPPSMSTLPYVQLESLGVTPPCPGDTESGARVSQETPRLDTDGSYEMAAGSWETPSARI